MLYMKNTACDGFLRACATSEIYLQGLRTDVEREGALRVTLELPFYVGALHRIGVALGVLFTNKK